MCWNFYRKLLCTWIISAEFNTKVCVVYACTNSYVSVVTKAECVMKIQQAAEAG